MKNERHNNVKWNKILTIILQFLLYFWMVILSLVYLCLFEIKLLLNSVTRLALSFIDLSPYLSTNVFIMMKKNFKVITDLNSWLDIYLIREIDTLHHFKQSFIVYVLSYILLLQFVENALLEHSLLYELYRKKYIATIYSVNFVSVWLTIFVM